MSVNKVILVGNVGKDPETRHLEGGSVVSKFSLATSEVSRNKDGEKVTHTEWHNIVLWRGLAEVAEKYVRKGNQLYIEGRIRSRSYTDKDNNTRYITEIVGDSMTLLGRKNEGPSGENFQKPSMNENNPQSQAPGNTNDVQPEFNGNSSSDDLPF